MAIKKTTVSKKAVVKKARVKKIIETPLVKENKEHGPFAVFAVVAFLLILLFSWWLASVVMAVTI